jgi:hypothetical protein
MKTIALFFSIIIGSLSTANAQERFERKLVDDATGAPVPKASVSLEQYKPGSTPSLKTSDDNGRFFFSDLNSGNYRLRITAVGYMPVDRRIEIPSMEPNGRFIRLKKDTTTLGGVTVVSSGPPVTQKQDTTQFSAAQYKVNPDASTEDLIKKMPGITVDRSGNVTAQGEQVRKVTVDGKDFFGDDATAALRNIPASAVDKIQLFDRLSEQAQLTGVSDGNEQKAINIITKAGIQNAQFGRIFAGAGSDGRYSGGGNISMFKNDRRISLVANVNNINQQNFGSQDMLGINGGNSGGGRGGGMGGGSFRGPGMGGPAENFSVDAAAGISQTNAFGINYGDKWGKRFSVTGSWFFNNSENNNESETNNLLFQKNQTTLRNSLAITKNTNHRFNARIEYKPDSSNQLTFIPSINLQKTSVFNNARLNSYLNAADSLFQSNSNSINERDGYTIKQSLQYRHNFAKKGRNIATSFNTTFNKNAGDAMVRGLFRFYDINGFPVLPDSVQDQLTNQQTNGQTWGGSISFNEPLGKKGLSSLQLEYNPSMQINTADQSTFQRKAGSTSVYDSSLSNEFDNQVMTHNGGLSYRFNPSKDEQFGITVNLQQTQLMSDRVLPTPATVDQTFQNVLPFAFWRKKISKYSNLRMFFRTSTTLPTINQLQDVISLTNPQSVNSGNKELRQSFSSFMGGRYNYTNTKTNRSLFVGVFFQMADDYISNATFIASGDSSIQNGIVLRKGAQLVKPINLNGYQSLRTNLSYSIPIKPLKTTVNLNGTFLYSALPGQINQIITKTQTLQYNLGLNLVSNISEYIDYNISYTANINRAETRGLVVTPNNYVNHVANASFNLLSKKGWFMQHDLTHQVFRGLSGSFDREFTLWNASIGKKFFKSKAGELKVTVFDLLKQNQSLSRTINNVSLEDSRSVVLSQYFMFTFSYNLKNIGKPKDNPEQQERRHW